MCSYRSTVLSVIRSTVRGKNVLLNVELIFQALCYKGKQQDVTEIFSFVNKVDPHNLDFDYLELPLI